MAGDFKQRVIFELVDEATGATKRISASMKAVGNAVDSVDGKTKKAEGSLTRFGNFLSKRFVFTLNDVAQGVRLAWDAIESTITLEGQEQALRNQLAAMGQGFDEFIGQLDKAAAGTVATADLISSSSRALLLGIPAEEIAGLLEIAGSRAQATGQDVSKAFDDITTGIGRASPLILDNLGLVVNLEEAYAEYAASLGVATEALTKNQQTTALLNAVLREGAEGLEVLGSASQNAAIELQKGKAEIENFANEAKKLGSVLGVGVVLSVKALEGVVRTLTIGFLDFFTAITTGIANLGFFEDAMQGAALRSFEFAQGQREIVAGIEKSGEALFGYIEGLYEEKTASEGAIEANKRRAEATIEATKADQDATASIEAKSVAIEESIPALDDFRANEQTVREETDRLSQSLDRAAASASKLNQATGGKLTARSSRNQADVDAALAAGRSPFLGGTRIRTADGSGSRLLS